MAGFHDLVLRLSATLVGVPTENVDAAVTRALEAIRDALGPGRAYVFRFSADGQRLTATHEACAPGIPSALAAFQNVEVAPLGWSMSRLLRGEVVAIRDPSDLPPEASAVREAMHALGLRSLVTVPLRAPSGVLGGLGFDWLSEPGSWSDEIVPLLRVAGEILAGVLVRAQAERDLLQVQARFQSFIDSMPEAVFCYEFDEPVPASSPPERLLNALLDGSRLVQCNGVYARPFGVERPSALYGRSLRELTIGQDAHDHEGRETPGCCASGEHCQECAYHSLREPFATLLRAGFPVDGVEVRRAQPDGTDRWERLHGSLVVQDGKVVRLWAMLRDITEQKEAEQQRRALEAQLRQAQKMESIGLLAGGVAHDFNNLLLVISSYAELARKDLRERPEAAEESLEQVVAAATRAAELTRGLLTFSRRQNLKNETLDLNETIRGFLGLLRRMIRESVELDFLPGHALGLISGDRAQLEQLLVNLCVNAADAIKDVGRITVETENVKLNGAYVRAHPWARPGRYVLLTVTDDGEGMTPEVRERIFEPFFTTKPPGRGTGLGLAVAYGIVQQHDGMIHVYSEVGRGTTFKVYLPIVEREATSVGVKLEGPVRRGDETILLAEDHEMVRDLARRVLQRAGYRVLVAHDGEDALRIFGEHADEIQLVLLDAIMPRKTGYAVYQELVARRPDLPVLFASGYTSSVFPDEFVAQHAGSFLAKPYDADELLRRVREALDRAGNPREPPADGGAGGRALA